MKKIRLLIADDHAIVRMGLKSLIAMEDDLELVGEAKNGTESVDAAERLKPDVVVMDLMMPKMDGVAATAEIRRRMPSVQVVVLTSFAGADAIAHALDVGAIGAVLKSAAETELVAAVRNAAAGRECVSPEIRRQLDAFLLEMVYPSLPRTGHQYDSLLYTFAFRHNILY